MNDATVAEQLVVQAVPGPPQRPGARLAGGRNDLMLTQLEPLLAEFLSHPAPWEHG
jgi:hypothetical protein